MPTFEILTEYKIHIHSSISKSAVNIPLTVVIKILYCKTVVNMCLDQREHYFHAILCLMNVFFFSCNQSLG